MNALSAPARIRARRRARRLEGFRLQNAGVVYALCLLVVVLTVVTQATGRGSYLSPVNTANVLDQTALVGIMAVFMTVVLISGNFDLSIGAIAALAGGLSLMLADRFGAAAAIVLPLAAGAALGLINGALVQGVGVNAFIVTLGSQTAIRAVFLLFTNGASVQAQSDSLYQLVGGYPPPLDLRVVAVAVALATVVAAAGWGLLSWRREGHPLDGRRAVLVGGSVVLCGVAPFLPGRWPLSKQAYVLFGVTLLSWLVLRFTVVGRRLYAVGGNAEAARLSGVSVAWYRVVPFVLNGLAAAAAGVLYAARFSAINPNALAGVELTVLAAAILGGTSLFGGAGSVVKSVIGALILFVLGNGFNILNLGANYQGLVQGIVIVGAAALYVVAARTRRRRRARARTRSPRPVNEM